MTKQEDSLENSLEFGKSCEDLSRNHGTSTPHRSETNGIAERPVRRIEEGTSAVLLQPGLDSRWWADSMECYCCLRKYSRPPGRLEKHRVKDDSENHSKTRSFLIPMPQAVKTPDAKAAVDNEWKSTQYQLGSWVKCRAKRRLFWKHKETKKDSPLCYTDGHLSSQKCGVGTKAPKIRRTSRADIVKDDSGAYAARIVSFVNDSRKSDWMLLRDYKIVLDKPPTQYQLYTPVKNGGRSMLLEKSNVRVSRFLDTSSTTQRGPNHGQTLKTRWFLLEEICTDTHLLASCGKDSWRKCRKSLDGNNCRIGTACLFIEDKGLFLSVFVDDIQNGWKEAENGSQVEEWMRNVDLDEPTSFPDHVYLGGTQREKRLLNSLRTCSNHEFRLELLKNYQGRKNFTRKRSRDPTTWKDMLSSAVRDVANWRIKKTEQSYKVSSPSLDDHNFKEELGNGWRVVQKNSQIVLECLYLTRIAILWSANKLARLVTKWTWACDKRLARLISYIHHTN